MNTSFLIVWNLCIYSFFWLWSPCWSLFFLLFIVKCFHSQCNIKNIVSFSMVPNSDTTVYFYYEWAKSIWFVLLMFYQKLDEAAVQSVFLKTLENYIKWCNYLVLLPVWSKYEFYVRILAIFLYSLASLWNIFVEFMLLSLWILLLNTC